MAVSPLRPYQKRDYDKLKRTMKRSRRVLFTACTGYGKTRVAGEIARDARKKNQRALFLAPWRELIPQTIARFEELGLRGVGVMMSGFDPDPGADVIVGSVETVRLWSARYPELREVSVVVLDEAHRYGTELRKEMMELWPKAHIVGVTATPFRRTRGGLGDLFDDLVAGATMEELIQLGFLVPPAFWTADPSSMRSFRVMPGSPHAPKPFERGPKQAHLVGDVVEEWKRVGVGKTLAFASDVSQSKAFATAFQKIGVKAEHLDANTTERERDAILERFHGGKTQIVTNCGVLCEGYDLPAIETVILKRTSSLMLYLQMCGRGLRSSPGKTECRILDPAGNVFRFGLPQEYRTWSLDGAPQERPLDERLRPDKPSHRLGPVHVMGELEALRSLPDDTSSAMKRLKAQGEASGYGMPWAIAEFRRLYGGPPAGKEYRQAAEEYLRRQAKAAGLPVSWAKERMKVLFG